MSLSSKLEALKHTYQNKNASLRILFEQRLDTLRNNIIEYIGNSLQDETANILNESDTTRAYVVDRILEIVSQNLESEKETTIFKLISELNDLNKKYKTLKQKNQELNKENCNFQNTKKNFNINSDEINNLRLTISDRESKIRKQNDKLKTIESELNIKLHEYERLQIQNDEQHENIQKLHNKLENTLKNLQNKDILFDKNLIQNKQLKDIHNKSRNEIKKYQKQIKNLTKSLIKSESERLILRKQYDDIGNKLELITKTQNNYIKQENQFKLIINENNLLKIKLNKQSNNISKKMKKELNKTELLSDDIIILKKQLNSERNISKMYCDEQQKLKFELENKVNQVNKLQYEYNDKFKVMCESQKKKIHKYYKKKLKDKINEIRNQYEYHIKDLNEKHQDSIIKSQHYEQQKFVEKHGKLLEKIKKQDVLSKDDKSKLSENETKIEQLNQKQEELQNDLDKYQGENEKLKNDFSQQNEKDKTNKNKYDKQIESYQRLLNQKQEENQNLHKMIITIREEKDAIQYQNSNEKYNANASQCNFQSQIRSIKDELKMEKQVTRKCFKNNKLIRKYCANIKQEIKNNKNEIKYIQSTISMSFPRLFLQISTSMNMILAKSTHAILKKDTTYKTNLSQTLKSFNKYQNYKIKSLEDRVNNLVIVSSPKKIENDNVDKNKLNISELEDEVNLIKNELANARHVLSPKEISFKSIIMPPSTQASTKTVSPTSSIKQPQKKNKSLSIKQIKQPKTYLKQESFDTRTIRKLRNDLQSLEFAYQLNQKETKKKYDPNSSLDSSINATT